jgi:cell division protein FtsI (penicillin-binding protein 3)
MAVLVVAIGLIVVKLADLQLLRPDDYRAWSSSQRVREQVLAAERGTLFDRSGTELAVNVPTVTIFADPLLVADPSAQAAELAPVLGLEVAEVEAVLAADNRFGYLARQVDREVADRVRSLGQPGVAFIDEPMRTTPNGELARAVVGSTDPDGVGISGLELAYADILTGEPGRLLLEQAPDGRTIPVGDYHLQPADPGQDLVLTLDRTLQWEVERILAEQVAEAGAAGGIAVVSQPATGDVLAVANVRRDTETDEVVNDANNAAFTTVYEPGSVMKPMTVAGSIEEGLVEPATVIEVTDSITLGDHVFSEHDPHGTVAWPVSQIIADSSNVGTIKLAQMLGAEGVHDYLRAFGLGEVTAVGFPNESAGFVRAPEDWWGSSIGSIPLGQGISVTPVQQLFAYNAIANGGNYVPPRLVAETVEADGTRHPFAAGEARRVVSEDTADKMNLMLRNVVAEGTGQLAAVKGYTPAGKTGTARKPQPDGGYVDQYGVTRYQATFVGFVPAEQPELSILVMIDEPSAGNIFGGQVAAPAFARIAEFGLRRYDVAPPSEDRAERFFDEVPGDLYESGVEPPRPGAAASLVPDRVRATPAGARPAGGADDTSTAAPGADGPTPAVAGTAG